MVSYFSFHFLFFFCRVYFGKGVGLFYNFAFSGCVVVCLTTLGGVGG